MESIMHRILTRRGCGVVVALFTGLVLVPISASAQVAPLPVSVTVVQPAPTCSIVAAPVTFADVDAGSTVTVNTLTAPYSFDVTCDLPGTGTATFDGGNNVGGNVRNLAHTGGDQIGYIIWEPGTVGPIISVGEAVPLTVITGTVTMAGDAVLAAQTIPASLGSYTDVVGVTFSF